MHPDERYSSLVPEGPVRTTTGAVVVVSVAGAASAAAVDAVAAGAGCHCLAAAAEHRSSSAAGQCSTDAVISGARSAVQDSRLWDTAVPATAAIDATGSAR